MKFMMRIATAVTLVVCALLVLYAEGVHWIVLWNLLPLVFAELATLRGTSAGRISWSAIAFAGLTAAAVTLIHAAWVLDWGGTQTGSSTAGLAFLASPVFAILLGTCGWAVAKAAQRFAGWRSTDGS